MQFDRRSFLKAAGGSLLFLASGEVEGTCSQRPNIILCMADDQGWGDMGYYGHPVVKTPNFDAMAKESLRFDRFYAAAPVCSPTRASVLTGRHPNRSGVLNHGLPMRPQEITLAEALKQSGYVTGHFGKWHVGSVQKTSPVNPANCGFDEWLSAPNYFDMNPIMSRNGVAVQCEGDSSEVVVDAAIEFMRKQTGSEKPFLAVVWFAAPHNPHEPSEQDSKLYEGEKHQGYFAEITEMDRAFGKLRKEVRTLGIRDNTILWYNSDNGGLVSESAGGREKKGSLYEGGLRVPAMLEWPERIVGSRTTDVPCNTSDIYPTLLEITGTKVKQQFPLDGISLVPLLTDRMSSRPKPMGFWQYPVPGRNTWGHKLMTKLIQAQKEGKETGEISRLDMDAGEIEKTYPENIFPGHAAWLYWPWKLHRFQKKDSHVKLELYNLSADSDERKDLAGQNADRVHSMKSQLETWQLSVVRSLNGRDYHVQR